MQEKSQYVSCFDLYKIMNDHNSTALQKFGACYTTLNSAFDFLPTLVMDVPDCGNMDVYTIQFEVTANVTFRGVSTMDPMKKDADPLPNLKLSTYAYVAKPGTDLPFESPVEDLV